MNTEIYHAESIGIVGVGVLGGELVEALSARYQVLANNKSIEETYLRLEEKGLQDKAKASDLQGIIDTHYVFITTLQKDLSGDTGVLRNLKEAGLQNHQVLISAVAGVGVDSIRQHTHRDQKVIRIMTGLGARIGKGMVAIYASDSVLQHERKKLTNMIECLGSVIECDTEDQIDLLTGVVGSHFGLDYFLTSAMEAVMLQGFSNTQAYSIIKGVYCGLADHERTTGMSFFERFGIIGKGRVTNELNRILQEGDLHNLIHKSLIGARIKTKELDLQKGA